MYKRISFLVVAFFMLIANGANARSWFYEPGLSLSAGYDDNPALDHPDLTDFASEGGPFAFIGGDIRLGSETASDLIAFDFEATARRYDESPELDSEYLRAAGIYQKTGINNDFGIEAGALKDSTLETRLQDFTRFRDDVDRNEIFILPTLTTRFSSLWIGDFSLGYNDVSYTARDDDAGADGFRDFENLSGSFQLNRIISERFSVFGLIDFLLYRPTEEITAGEVERDDFAGLRLGMTYNLSQNFDMLLSAGPGSTETKLSETGETVKFSDYDVFYDLELNYTGARNTFRLTASRAFEATSAGGLFMTERYGIEFSRPHTLGGTLEMPFSYVTRDPARLEIGSRVYYEFRPGIFWQTTQNLVISAEVRYREEELNGLLSGISSRSDSTAVFMGLRYDFGRKRISY